MPQENNKPKMEQINFRLSQEEKDLLKKRASNSGMKLSRYIRRVAIEKDPVFIPESDREILRELLRAAFEIKRSLNKYHEARTPDLNEYYQTIREVNKRLNKFK